MFGKSVRLISTLLVAIELCNGIPFAVSNNVYGMSRNTASRGDFTYQVSYRIYQNAHSCGGALLSDRWILTSASCVYNGGSFQYNQAVIVVGGHDLREGHSYLCDFVKTHEYFDYSTRENDIALARTSRPIVFNKFIQPIPYLKGTAACNTNAVSIGWDPYTGNNGEEVLLSYSNMTILSKKGCDFLFKERSGSNLSPGVSCAKYPISYEDVPCFSGDNGAPISTSDSRVLFGITSSYGQYVCGDVSDPTTFTPTSAVSGWILRNTNVDGVSSL